MVFKVHLLLLLRNTGSYGYFAFLIPHLCYVLCYVISHIKELL